MKAYMSDPQALDALYDRYQESIPGPQAIAADQAVDEAERILADAERPAYKGIYLLSGHSPVNVLVLATREAPTSVAPSIVAAFAESLAAFVAEEE
jgi:hypothetical protein